MGPIAERGGLARERATVGTARPNNGGSHWTRRRRLAPLWGFAIGILVAAIYWPGMIGALPGLDGSLCDLKPFRVLDLRLGDFLHRVFYGDARAHNIPPICVIGITSEELERYGTMPWRRKYHADLVPKLTSCGARVIAFDIYFTRPSADDDVFAAACRESGRVILPRWGLFPEMVPLTDNASALPGTGTVLSTRSARPMRTADGVFRESLRETAEKIYAAARAQGHINVFYDSDLVARRVPAAIGAPDAPEMYLPLGIVAAMCYEGIPTESARLDQRWLTYGDVRIPLDSTGCIMINYHPFDKWVDMRPAELQDLAKKVAWLRTPRFRAPIRFYSYEDVLQDRVPEGAFKDAIVLIGQCVWGSREDVHLTPEGSQFGVFVQAMLLHTALSRQFLRPVAPWKIVLAALLFSVTLGTLCFATRYSGSTYSTMCGGVLGVGLILALTLISVGFLRRLGLVIDVSPFLLGVALNVTGGMAANSAMVTAEAVRRNEEIELLLAAAERHAADWMQREHVEKELIPGASELGFSASFAARSPEIVAETFWRTVPCEGCLLYQPADEGDDVFRETVSLGFHVPSLRTQARRVADHIMVQRPRTYEVLTLTDKDPGSPLPSLAPDVRALLVSPLLARGEVLALVFLVNKVSTHASPSREFTDTDIRLVAGLRYQAGALLENARRYRLEYAMFNGFAESMAKAVDVRDRYTHGHSNRVAELSRGIAQELGLSQAEQEIIHRAATLHDVGKIGVSDAVLNNPGKLTEEEFSLIRSHAAKGYEILRDAPSFAPLLGGIRHHHERYDGTGYPDGLIGESIPLIARIIAVADAFDAMTSDRVYRKAMPVWKAREELIRSAGAQFDAEVVQAMLRYLDSHPEEAQRGQPSTSNAARPS